MNPATLHPSHSEVEDSQVDYEMLWRRIKRGSAPTLGIVLIAIFIGGVASIVGYRALPPETTMRIRFSWPGIEKGQNPDGSPFLAEEIRAPDVVRAALQARGLNFSEQDEAALRRSI